MVLPLLLPFQLLIAMRIQKQDLLLVLQWWKNSFKCSVNTAETNMKGCSEDPDVGSVTIFSDSMDRLIIKSCCDVGL